MKSEELKEGGYVKWVADRHFKSWNTYGKIVSLTETEVSILTYDDLETTTIGREGEAMREEISPATKWNGKRLNTISKNNQKNLTGN
jgi:hypothetical protein